MWQSRALQPLQIAPGLLLSRSLSLSSSACPSTSPSPSHVCPQTFPCTPHPATSRRRSCTCSRAACTAGGARWRTTREVQRLPPAHTHTHLHIYMPCPFSHACHVLVMPDLQGSISRIHRTIELMYSDKTMMQVRFKRKINKVLDYNN